MFHILLYPEAKASHSVIFRLPSANAMRIYAIASLELHILTFQIHRKITHNTQRKQSIS